MFLCVCSSFLIYGGRTNEREFTKNEHKNIRTIRKLNFPLELARFAQRRTFNFELSTFNSPLELARFLKCQASPFGMPSALFEELSTLNFQL